MLATRSGTVRTALRADTGLGPRNLPHRLGACPWARPLMSGLPVCSCPRTLSAGAGHTHPALWGSRLPQLNASDSQRVTNTLQVENKGASDTGSSRR